MVLRKVEEYTVPLDVVFIETLRVLVETSLQRSLVVNRVLLKLVPSF